MKKQLAELVLKGDRLYLVERYGHSKIEHDITGVWFFFRDAMEWMKTPESWEESKLVSDARDALIQKQAQENLLEEIEDIAAHHEEDAWSVIKTHLSINKPFHE